MRKFLLIFLLLACITSIILYVTTPNFVCQAESNSNAKIGTHKPAHEKSTYCVSNLVVESKNHYKYCLLYGKKYLSANDRNNDIVILRDPKEMDIMDLQPYKHLTGNFLSHYTKTQNRIKLTTFTASQCANNGKIIMYQFTSGQYHQKIGNKHIYYDLQNIIADPKTTKFLLSLPSC